MKYFLVIFAVLVLSLVWLSERYKSKAREAATTQQPASVQPGSPATPNQPAQEQAPTGRLPQSREAASDGAPEVSRTAPNTPPAEIPPPNAPLPAAMPVPSSPAPGVAVSTDAAAAGPAEAAAKQEKPEKDWAKLCYDASMLADRGMRRHQDGATAAELTNIGNQADVDLRSSMQGVMNQVGSMPRSSDFAQQQLMLDNIKSSTYNDCMAGHR